jgi:hypothetical protein
MKSERAHEGILTQRFAPAFKNKVLAIFLTKWAVFCRIA